MVGYHRYYGTSGGMLLIGVGNGDYRTVYFNSELGKCIPKGILVIKGKCQWKDSQKVSLKLVSVGYYK